MVEKNKSSEDTKPELPDSETKKKLPVVLLYIWISGWGGSMVLAYLLLFSENDYPTVFLALWMGLASGFFLLALVRLVVSLFKK